MGGRGTPCDARAVSNVVPLLVRLAAALGASGVALGAFGAHALKARLPADLLAIYHTGVDYHLLHALALVGLAALAPHVDARRVRLAGLAMSVGVVVFSGSLYALALSGTRWLGAITPLGGVAFIVGWVLLFTAARPRAEGSLSAGG
jgi:uncharacterized membrane protein YgdD (TMEM256/DUF423 family)